MKRRLIITALILSFFGCSQSTDQLASEPLAKVGDRTLYFDDLKQSVPDYMFKTDSIAVVRNYMEQWIRSQVLLDEATRLGLDANPVIKNRIEKAIKDIMIAELRNQIQLNSVSDSISAEEVARFYTSNREMFVLNERHVKARHLFSLDNVTITTARTELASGVPWDEIVSKYAIDPEYSMQTDKQLVAVSQAFSGYPTLKSYLGVIGLNEVSPITQESGYYHFIQIVEDRPEGDHPELPYVFDRIQEWLRLDRSRRAFKTYEQNLLVQAEANGEIVIYLDNN